MGRKSFDYTHGDTGKEPTSPLNFESNGRPDAQNFDWWWYNVIEAINSHAAEFDRLDSDNDGKIGNAEYADNADKVDGQHWSDIKQWVNNESDVPNADHADTADTADGAATWSEEGVLTITAPTDINFTGNITLTDNGDGTVDVTVTKYTNGEARSAVMGEVDAADLIGAKGSDGQILTTNGSSASWEYPKYPVRTTDPSDPDEGEAWIVE